MNFFKKRQVKKIMKQILHEATHAKYMREDLAAEEEIKLLDDLKSQVKESFKQNDMDQFEKAGQQLADHTVKILPNHKHAVIKEWVEVIAVALAVAMGFRTYFLQPFKIPTGSMQETLYGITYKPTLKKELIDQFPLNIINWAYSGELYKEFKAPVEGQVGNFGPFNRVPNTSSMIWLPIGNKQIKVPMEAQFYIKAGDYVTKGTLLASAKRKTGDHILVNKVAYNFSRPERGQIIVFNTHGIKYEGVQKDTYYIKRLVGMPQENIGIKDNHLHVNGAALTQPSFFKDKQYVLPGHGQPSVFSTPDQSCLIPANHYLMFGDNTLSSLDGRYFGPVIESEVLGPAFAIHWPFSRWRFTNR